MTSPPSVKTLVCEEVFDENSQPSEEEIKEYAKNVGIDPDSEPHLLQYARDGLMRALPAGWKPCFDEELQAYYYFNTKTGESRWEHPVDRDVKELIKKVRSESISSAGEDDSKTSAKEDLKSFEEASLPNSAMFPKSEPLKPITGSLKRASLDLGLMKRSTSQSDISAAPLKATSPFIKSSAFNQKKLSLRSPVFSSGSREETESPTREDSSTGRDTSRTSDIGAVRKVFTTTKRKDISSSLSGASSHDGPRFYGSKVETPSPTGRIDIDNMDLLGLSRQDSNSKKERLTSAQEKHPRSMHGRAELTLTGGGSMFLKSKQKSDDKSPSADESSTMDAEKQVLLAHVQNNNDSIPKSILRDQRGSVRQLWDVDPRLMSSEEKQLWRKQELEEERKSVRFNLDKDPDIRFNVSESEMDEEDDGDDDDEEDWNSDDDDDKDSSGAKSSDVLRVKDSSELDDISPKNGDGVVSSLDDKLETQIAKDNYDFTYDEPDKHDEPNMLLRPVSKGSKLSDILGPRIAPPLKKIPPIIHNNALKNVWVERGNLRKVAGTKRVFEIQRVAEDVNGHPEHMLISKGVELNEDKRVDTYKQESIKPVTEGDSRKTRTETGNSEEILEMKLEDASAELRRDHESRLSDLKHELSNMEKLERTRLLDQFHESMKTFEQGLVMQQEEREKQMRKSMEVSLKELETTLISERGIKYRELQQEFEEQCSKQRNEMERKLSEEKTRLENDFKEHLEEFKKVLLEREEIEKAVLLDKMESELRGKQSEELEARLSEQKLKLKQETDDKLSQLKEEYLHEEEKKVRELKEALQHEMEVKLCNLKKELERDNEQQIDQLKETLAANADKKRLELIAEHRQILNELEQNLREEFETEKLSKEEQLRAQMEKETVSNLNFEDKRKQLEQEHEDILAELQEQHSVRMESYRTALKLEEEATRREHAEHLEEMKIRLQRELDVERQKVKAAQNDNQSETTRSFEKMRCEKRLLEDKYRSLKDKYTRLKTDVKISIERRKRRDNSNTTGSETSTSHRANKTSLETRHIAGDDRAHPNDNEKNSKKQQSEISPSDNNNDDVHGGGGGRTTNKTVTAQVSKNLLSQLSPDVSLDQDSIKDEIFDEDDFTPPCTKPASSKNAGEGNTVVSFCLKDQTVPVKHVDIADRQQSTRHRRLLFGRSKSASGSVSRHKDADCNNKADSHSPIENLRRQLKKLEDLEDEFPPSTHTDTYLPYPFQDTDHIGSADLEFFRHRIHLERASIKRAKDLLRAQQNNFQSRLRDLRKRQMDGSARAHSVLEQLYQEERELADMEINLHHTRSTIGEKIIRLRHLEDSLHRANLSLAGSRVEPTDDQTLSDLSSQSASSGFSSTEHPADIHSLPAEAGYPESAKIIHSLENLNSEIREIWDALKRHEQKSRDSGFVASKPCPDITWPTIDNVSATAYLRSQHYPQLFRVQVADESRLEMLALEERARKLREWLAKARLYDQNSADQ